MAICFFVSQLMRRTNLPQIRESNLPYSMEYAENIPHGGRIVSSISSRTLRALVLYVPIMLVRLFFCLTRSIWLCSKQPVFWWCVQTREWVIDTEQFGTYLGFLECSPDSSIAKFWAFSLSDGENRTENPPTCWRSLPVWNTNWDVLIASWKIRI